MGGKVVAITLIAVLSLSVLTYVDVFAYNQVRVVGHKMSVDDAGLVHISGIVENASNDAVRFVRVIAYLYDKNGNELPTHDTYTLLRTISPGYIAPFDIPINDQRVNKNVASYTLSLEWKNAEPKADKFEFSDLKAFVWTHLDPRTKEFRNPHGIFTNSHHALSSHTEISALVKNTGGLATKTVKVIAIWYDERGQYYSYDIQTVAGQLASMENNRFVIMTHPTMGYYSLIAESGDYVSMLMDNDDRMFRVYEANADNRHLAGVDTMGINDIVVKDSVDTVIDKIPVKNKPVLPHFTPTLGESISINADGKQFQLQIKTYANKLLNFSYDEQTKTITMSTNKIDTTDTFHAEIVIPNTFDEFLSAKSFEATLNEVVLHDKIFLVDPYSYEGKTAMHFIISSDELKVLSKQMLEQYSNRLTFTIQPVASNKAVSIKVGEPIQVQSIVTNNIDKKQKFVYVLRVKDSTGATVMTSWIDGMIEANESMNATLSWTPEKEGNYTMQIFLWESLTYTSTMSSNFANSNFVVY